MAREQRSHLVFCMDFPFGAMGNNLGLANQKGFSFAVPPETAPNAIYTLQRKESMANISPWKWVVVIPLLNIHLTKI